jgi:hypothetical protein
MLPIDDARMAPSGWPSSRAEQPALLLLLSITLPLLPLEDDDHGCICGCCESGGSLLLHQTVDGHG